MDAAPAFGGVQAVRAPATACCRSGIHLSGGSRRRSGPACIEPQRRAARPGQPGPLSLGGERGRLRRHHHAARRAGATPGTIVEGGRRLPDGSWLGWRVLGIADHPYGGLVPFFIDWGESRHPAQGAPRGGTLSGIDIAHPQAAELEGFLGALGLPFPCRVANARRCERGSRRRAALSSFPRSSRCRSATGSDHHRQGDQNGQAAS